MPLRFAAAVPVVLCALPVGYVLVDTLATGWAEAYALVVRPRVGELLVSTVLLVVSGVVTSVVLGVALAWLVERAPLPARRGFRALLAVPLAVPAFVTSFGWVSLAPSVASPAGALLVVTLAYYPLVFLPVAAALDGLDGALEEAAAALGLGTGARLRRVVLPQLRPAVLGGALLVSLHLLAEFGALQLLGVTTFTTAIYDQYESSFGGPAASALATVLLALCAILLAAEIRLRGNARYARVGSGARRTPTAAVPLEGGRRGAASLASTGAATAVVVLALGVPLGSIVGWLVTSRSTAFPVAELATSAATSIGLGLGGALLTTGLALPLAVLAVRSRSRSGRWMQAAVFGASALPGIVVGLALVSIALTAVPALYQTLPLLLVAYAVLFLPRALVSVRAGLEQAPAVMDEVSASLGVSRLGHLARVVLPLTARSCGAGAALVFLGVSTELTATLLLAPLGTATLATEFWASSSQVAYGEAAPYAALLVLLSVPATVVLVRAVNPRTPWGAGGAS